MKTFSIAFKAKNKKVQNHSKNTNQLQKSSENIDQTNVNQCKLTKSDDERRFQSLAKSISNYEIPNLADTDVQISIKNVESIKDLFFRAESIRLQIIDMK